MIGGRYFRILLAAYGQFALACLHRRQAVSLHPQHVGIAAFQHSRAVIGRSRLHQGGCGQGLSHRHQQHPIGGGLSQQRSDGCFRSIVQGHLGLVQGDLFHTLLNRQCNVCPERTAIVFQGCRNGRLSFFQAGHRAVFVHGGILRGRRLKGNRALRRIACPLHRQRQRIANKKLHDASVEDEPIPFCQCKAGKRCYHDCQYH